MGNFRQALLHLVTSVLVADFDFFRFSANENVDKREKNLALERRFLLFYRSSRGSADSTPERRCRRCGAVAGTTRARPDLRVPRQARRRAPVLSRGAGKGAVVLFFV